MPRIIAVIGTHSGLPDVTIDQHHARDHALSAAVHTGALSEAQGRTEAKATAGAAVSESVTWTTAFSGAPIVSASDVTIGANPQDIPAITSVSTTGATLTEFTSTGTAPTARVKHVLARMAT